MPQTPTPLTLTMRDARARVRTGGPDLAAWLTQWRPTVPASVWPDLVYVALKTRNPVTVRNVLDQMPEDWRSSSRKPERVSGHRMFHLLAPIRDGSVEAQLLQMVLPWAPAEGRESLLFALQNAPDTLAAVWDQLPPTVAAEKGWVRHWLKEKDPAMIRRWLTLAHPAHLSDPGLVEDGVRWLAAKPQRLSALEDVWPDLLAAWSPTPLDVLTPLVSQLRLQDGALLPLLHRARELKAIFDLPWAQGNLTAAVWSEQAAKGAAWVAVLPVALTVPTLHRAVQDGAAHQVDQCLVHAQGQSDPHGHLDALAVALAGQPLPAWQACRRAQARQCLLADRPASGARTTRRRS